MTTIQFPLYTGESYTATLYEINGTQIQANVPANEIIPGVFNVDFETVPDGFYRIVVSSSGAPLYTDTVKVAASKEINNVVSEVSIRLNEPVTSVVEESELGSECVYNEAYPDVYPDAYPCDVDTGGFNNFELCITDSNNNPLENATVKVCSEQVTGPNGLVQFDLAPGTYTAEVIFNGQSQSVTEFNV